MVTDESQAECHHFPSRFNDDAHKVSLRFFMRLKAMITDYPSNPAPVLICGCGDQGSTSAGHQKVSALGMLGADE